MSGSLVLNEPLISTAWLINKHWMMNSTEIHPQTSPFFCSWTRAYQCYAGRQGTRCHKDQDILLPPTKPPSLPKDDLKSKSCTWHTDYLATRTSPKRHIKVCRTWMEAYSSEKTLFLFKSHDFLLYIKKTWLFSLSYIIFLLTLLHNHNTSHPFAPRATI